MKATPGEIKKLEGPYVDPCEIVSTEGPKLLLWKNGLEYLGFKKPS
jgi:hypothetical protein